MRWVWRPLHQIWRSLAVIMLEGWNLVERWNRYNKCYAMIQSKSALSSSRSASPHQLQRNLAYISIVPNNEKKNIPPSCAIHSLPVCLGTGVVLVGRAGDLASFSWVEHKQFKCWNENEHWEWNVREATGRERDCDSDCIKFAWRKREQNRTVLPFQVFFFFVFFAFKIRNPKSQFQIPQSRSDPDLTIRIRPDLDCQRQHQHHVKEMGTPGQARPETMLIIIIIFGAICFLPFRLHFRMELRGKRARKLGRNSSQVTPIPY